MPTSPFKAPRGRWSALVVGAVLVALGAALALSLRERPSEPGPSPGATAPPATAAAMAASPAAPERTVDLCLSPPVARVSPRDEVALDVVVEPGGKPVAGVQALVTFDPGLLEAVEVQKALASPMETELAVEVDNEAGLVTYAAGTFSPSPPSARFHLARITFRARGPRGVARVEFVAEGLRRTAASTAGRDLSRAMYGAAVSIDGTTVPTPPGGDANPCGP